MNEESIIFIVVFGTMIIGSIIAILGEIKWH